MSEFSISADQRRQLLEAGNDPDEDYEPLDFDIKPFGCKVGARYVLAWQRARKFAVRDRAGQVVEVRDIPAEPLWWITVTAVVRHRKGFWRVRYEVTDLRCPTIYLARGRGDYTTSKQDAIDPLPAVVDDEVREKAREEFWHARRLARFAVEQRARSRLRRQRRAA